MALARLSLIKSAAFLNLTSTDFDTELKLLLPAATDRANRFCNRRLESTTHTDEYHSGDGTNILYLNEYPVTALSAVSIWDTATETFVSESTSYMRVMSDDQGIARTVYYPKLGQEDNATYSTWPVLTGDANIKATYTAGYVTTSWDTAALSASFDVPEDLEWAVAHLAAVMWMEGKGGGARIGVKGKSVGSQDVSYERFEKGMTDEVLQILKGYKRPGF